jgi:hypothetical protein
LLDETLLDETRFRQNNVLDETTLLDKTTFRRNDVRQNDVLDETMSLDKTMLDETTLDKKT